MFALCVWKLPKKRSNRTPDAICILQSLRYFHHVYTHIQKRVCWRSKHCCQTRCCQEAFMCGNGNCGVFSTWCNVLKIEDRWWTGHYKISVQRCVDLETIRKVFIICGFLSYLALVCCKHFQLTVINKTCVYRCACVESNTFSICLSPFHTTCKNIVVTCSCIEEDLFR